MHDSERIYRRTWVLIAALLIGSAGDATAQVTASTSPTTADTPVSRLITLEDALRLAARSSDAVRIAQASVRQAESQQLTARSQYLPQVSATGSYSRTLASPLQGAGGGSSSAQTDSGSVLQSLCTPPLAANATAEERAAALSQATTCAATGGLDLSRAGFGARNTYNLALSGSYGLFAPGRSAQVASAEAGRRSADIEVTSQRAQLVLDVTEAYYDAALSDRLVSIAEASLAQTERVVSQTQLAKEVGDQSGYEVLRAQVSRDNQVPVVLQQRNSRELAYLTLKQLLQLDPDAALHLADIAELASDAASTVPIANERVAEVPADVVRGASAAGIAMATSPSDTVATARAAVRQQEEAVAQQEATVQQTRAQRLPSVNLTASYGESAYPAALLPTVSQLSTSASVGLSVSVPLFTGGRQRANELAAEAALERTRTQLAQTRKNAALDARQTILTLAQAEATFAATAQTVKQATRAHDIAQVRYREGIATQTEVTEARIAQAQALSNRAQSGRDLLVARVRLALLSDLPLMAGGSGATTGSTGTGTRSTGLAGRTSSTTQTSLGQTP